MNYGLLKRGRNYKKFKSEKLRKEKKMKKILSLALVASLMFGTVAVKAQTTDLVEVYDFTNLTPGTIDDAGLSALGITADTADKATMAVVDLSEDATYGSLGKVLSWTPTAQNSKLEFPVAYTLSADEKLVVEYDYKWVATSASDSFGSGEWGSVGLLYKMALASGGNGWLHRIYSNSSTSGYLEMGNKNATNWCQVNWLHVKTEYDYAKYLADNSSNCATTVISDVATGDVKKTINSTLNKTAVGNLVFNNTNGIGQVYLDNIHVYTVPKLKLTASSITDGAGNVFYDTKEIRFSFSNTIADASTVTVSKDGAEMPEGSYTVTPSGNSVVIAFTEDLNFGSSYTVELAGVTDDLGQVMGEETISFTVESEPDVRLGELKLIKGIGGTSQTVSELTAANGLQSISLELENLKSEAKDVNVMFAIYEASNRRFVGLRNVVTSIPANETRTVYIGADMTDLQGKIIKAFVWESWSTLRPWFGGTELEVK